jgi:hypothetical protein
MTDSERDTPPSALSPREKSQLGAAEELPVVARIVVEIRSDGARTLARGAMEDVTSETRVALEASGGTPLELALALAKSIMAAPWLPRAPLTKLSRLLKKP